MPAAEILDKFPPSATRDVLQILGTGGWERYVFRMETRLATPSRRYKGLDLPPFFVPIIM